LKLAILGAAAVKAATPKSVHLGERDNYGKPGQIAIAGPIHIDSESQVDGQFDDADSRTKEVAHHATQHWLTVHTRQHGADGRGDEDAACGVER
jgi:hypothetical protein